MKRIKMQTSNTLWKLSFCHVRISATTSLLRSSFIVVWRSQSRSDSTKIPFQVASVVPYSGPLSIWSAHFLDQAFRFLAYVFSISARSCTNETKSLHNLYPSSIRFVVLEKFQQYTLNQNTTFNFWLAKKIHQLTN